MTQKQYEIIIERLSNLEKPDNLSIWGSWFSIVGLPLAIIGLIFTYKGVISSKEAAKRAEIAAVFVRRLRLGMRLQTDPTVIYALGEHFDGNIRKADLALDSPYNTYVYSGLPPTPIALCGIDALHASLHPAASEALYFVARGDGSSEFSNSLDAHERAVNRYQRGQ